MYLSLLQRRKVHSLVSFLGVDKIVETMRSGNTLDELSDKILELIRSKNPNYKPAEIWDIEGNVKNVKEEITVVDKKQNTKIFLM